MDPPKIPERPRKSQASPAPSANIRTESSESIPQIPALRPRPKIRPDSLSANNTDTDTSTSHSIPSPGIDQVNLQFPRTSILGDDGETTPGNTNVRATLKAPNDESDQFDDDADTIAMSEDAGQSNVQLETVQFSNSAGGTRIEDLESLEAESRTESNNNKHEYYGTEVKEMAEMPPLSEDVIIPSPEPQHVPSETSQVDTAPDHVIPAASADDDKPLLQVFHKENPVPKDDIQPAITEESILEEPEAVSEAVFGKPSMPSIPVRPIKRLPTSEERAISRAAEEAEASLPNPSESLAEKNISLPEEPSTGSEEPNTGLEEKRSFEAHQECGNETEVTSTNLHSVSPEGINVPLENSQEEDAPATTHNDQIESFEEAKGEDEVTEAGGNEPSSTDTQHSDFGVEIGNSKESVSPQDSDEVKLTPGSELLPSEISDTQSSSNADPSQITKATPSVPSRPARPAKASTSLDTTPKKAAPPPKPKKLLSKIAAFQQMFNQPENAAPAPQASSSAPGSRGKLNSDHMGFAANLQNVVGRGIALPGMGGAVNQEMLKKLSPAEVKTGEEENDEPKAPTRRVRGPRGKKLPKSIENSDLKLEPRFKVFANELWEVRLTKAENRNDEVEAEDAELEVESSASTSILPETKQENGAETHEKSETETEPLVEESQTDRIATSELVTTHETDQETPAVVSALSAPPSSSGDTRKPLPAEVKVTEAGEDDIAHGAIAAAKDGNSQTLAGTLPAEPEIPGAFDVSDSKPDANHPNTDQDWLKSSLLPHSESAGLEEQSQDAPKSDFDPGFLEAAELSVAELQDYVGQHGNMVPGDEIPEERAD